MIFQFQKFKVLVLFFFAVLNFSLVVFISPKAEAKPSLNESSLSVLKKFNIKPSDVSLEMLHDHKKILTINAEEKKIPASISKLFTSLAVLKRFPTGHRFYTRLYWDGKNLYLKGGGDPSFVSESMWFLVNEFNRTGISDILGDIVVDDSIFDRVRYDESRESVRVDRAYDSPVGGMSFNWNAVNIFVKGTQAGQKARVVVDPENGYFELINNTKSVDSDPKKDLVATISNENKIITVSGDVDVKNPEKAIFKSIENPETWSGHNLAFFLKQRGISHRGKIKTGITPENAELVAQAESKSLPYILADMNKFSNNFVAEMLVKGMAAQESKSNASLAQGVAIINSEIKKIGLTENQVVFKNPSGLTRENKFSASSLNRALTEIKDDFRIYPTFVDSLPIAGVDGTLKKRFRNTAGEGWIRAKTGYLSGVVSLAGYAGRKDGHIYTFSFLYNGPREESVVREAFDQILLNSLK